jgi:predicted O-linked N-acetylglucosamine transferase (SPINDLY family)
MSDDDILSHFIFIPRLPHPQYLMMISFLGVFLNTFPFGSGITSSEALSLCVPIVLLPLQTSYLHFAAAQITSMFPEENDYDRYIAKSEEEYVELAVSYASMSATEHNYARQLICEKKEFLFGDKSLFESINEWQLLLFQLYSNS